MSTQPDVAVLREGTEGLSMASYAEALRKRLLDRTVAHARTPRQKRDLVVEARVATGVVEYVSWHGNETRITDRRRLAKDLRVQ